MSAIQGAPEPSPAQPGAEAQRTQGSPRSRGPLIRPHLLVDAPLIGGALSLAVAGPPLAALAFGAGLLAFQAWAAVHPRAAWFLPVHARLPVGSAACALTFDDGPHPEVTPRVLDLLAAHGQRATFFVVGMHARAHGGLLRRIRAEGHALGLHSDTHHRAFNCWGPGAVRRDLERCAQAVADATGEAPPRLFRPPVGLKNPIVASVVQRLALVTVTWSARAWDTAGAPPGRIAARLVAGARPRAIVLLHDGHEPAHPGDRAATAAALALALPTLPTRSVALAATDDARGRPVLAVA